MRRNARRIVAVGVMMDECDLFNDPGFPACHGDARGWSTQ